MWRRPANLAPVSFPPAALPTSNKVTAHFSFFIGLKGPFRFGHETQWSINPQVYLPYCSDHRTHRCLSHTLSNFVLISGSVTDRPHNRPCSLALSLCRLPNCITERTTALMMIICGDSDPFKSHSKPDNRKWGWQQNFFKYYCCRFSLYWFCLQFRRTCESLDQWNHGVCYSYCNVRSWRLLFILTGET